MGTRFSSLVQNGPVIHLSSCAVGTGSFPEVNQRGCGLNYPPPSSAEVKEIVALYLYSPSGLQDILWGKLHLFLNVN
jgi:hypothetical protein